MLHCIGKFLRYTDMECNQMKNEESRNNPKKIVAELQNKIIVGRAYESMLHK